MPSANKEKLFSPHTSHTPYRALAFVTTTTPEKLHDYQAAADAQGIPIKFTSIYDAISSFHSVEETGSTSDANASLKLNGIKASVEKLRGADAEEQLKELCAHHGVEWQPDRSNIFFATDDTILRFRDKKIWAEMEKMLEPFVPKELLDRATANGKLSGPGAETGAIIFAVTPFRFFDMAKEAALKCGYSPSKHITIDQETALNLECLGKGGKEPYTLHMGENVVYTLQDAEDKWRKSGKPIATMSDCLRLKTQPRLSLNDQRPDYLPYHSTRARAVGDFSKKSGYTPSPRLHVSSIQPTATRKKPSYVVGLAPSLQEGNTHESLLAKLSEKFIAYQPDGSEHNTNITPSHAMLRSIEDVMANSHAIILPPFDKKDPLQKLWNGYLLNSIVVAKQLIARDQQKDVVLMDVDGCWKELVKLFHYDLVNKGMSKDFHPLRPYKGANHGNGTRDFQGCQHHWNSYFDMLSASDEKTVRKATFKLLEECEKNFTPRAHVPATPHNDTSELDARREKARDNQTKGRYKVGVYLSASSDNKKLLECATHIGKHIAARGWVALWGGGDRHAMGAFYQGNRAYHKETGEQCLIEAYSTPEIVELETEHGRFPAGVSFSKLNSDIYDRMYDLLSRNNDAVILGGGSGTSQEMLAAAVLMKQFPDEMKGKHLIICDHALHTKQEDTFWKDVLPLLREAGLGDQLIVTHNEHETCETLDNLERRRRLSAPRRESQAMAL